MKIGSIEKIMLLKGYSKDWMASQLGMSERQFSRYMSGEAEWTVKLLEDVAKVFQMSLVEVLSFDEKMVFNHCTQDHSVFGNGNQYHAADPALVAELKSHIEDLKSENAFLREELKTTRNGGS
ncbi:MAG: helix-turn-helix transcriptional regulator, partial [Flavobacteriales bacterium]|nr:helix-turn-helix transcriptional regulator [Flavobacteriales bacterium]